MKITLFIVINFFLFACSSNLEENKQKSDKCDNYSNKLKSTPAAELYSQQKIKREYGFLAVRDYTVSFPGLEKMTYQDIKTITQKKRYVIIKGTSDHVSSISCDLYQDEAREYARAFNMLSLNDQSQN